MQECFRAGLPLFSCTEGVNVGREPNGGGEGTPVRAGVDCGLSPECRGGGEHRQVVMRDEMLEKEGGRNRVIRYKSLCLHN